MERTEEIRFFDVREGGERLDIFLANECGQSRARIQALLLTSGAAVNGIRRKANYRLSAGDRIAFSIPPPEKLSVLPENIPLDIVYQDSDMVIVNKAQGMVVHPAPGNTQGTLVNALLYAIGDLSGVGGMLRPGIVHRIDKMTSGLVVVAKNDHAHMSLSGQFHAHTARRTYLAIVEGNMREDGGMVDAPVDRHPVDRKRMAVVEGGRQAITHWRVLQRMGQFTLIEAQLETGRTHQIRVHMAREKHPVAGDRVYGPDKPALGLEGQALHAYKLELTHPRSGERLVFYAPPPPYFMQALKRAGWDGSPVWEQATDEKTEGQLDKKG